MERPSRYGHHHDLAAPAGQQAGLRQRGRGVVAALHPHVRTDPVQHGQRRVLVEHGDRVHAAQRGQHPDPVPLRHQRPGRALEPAHRGVRVHAHHQAVAEPAGRLQGGHVPGVQQVEAAAGGDHGAAGGAGAPHHLVHPARERRLGRRPRLRRQRRGPAGADVRGGGGDAGGDRLAGQVPGGEPGGDGGREAVAGAARVARHLLGRRHHQRHVVGGGQQRPAGAEGHRDPAGPPAPGQLPAGPRGQGHPAAGSRAGRRAGEADRLGQVGGGQPHPGHRRLAARVRVPHHRQPAGRGGQPAAQLRRRRPAPGRSRTPAPRRRRPAPPASPGCPRPGRRGRRPGPAAAATARPPGPAPSPGCGRPAGRRPRSPRRRPAAPPPAPRPGRRPAR